MTVAPDRVYFHYHSAAPLEPARLDAVNGAAEVRALPGVTGYRLVDLPGQHLPGGVHTYGFDLLCGDAPDHGSMVDTVRSALELLSFQFTVHGEPVTVRTELTRRSGRAFLDQGA